ncbi:MAG TPA: hypothetical protein VNJ02_04495 [Vicinamibacterales bacterium]|nr:hypothetical protein [Vicinamibacterales bacterium]
MASLALLTLTLLITWPLGAHLTSALPGDYGDPVFVSWVMAWVGGQLTTALSDPATLASFWDANIFFPETRALAFSEHFVAQTVLALPVYWATGNSILTYNVAFILSFVLTGLGTFLLVRAMTASALAGFLAACVVAFNEYRLVYEIAHLHVLSIHWFPFALLGLHRYFETDRRRYLAWTALALIALNLSSIYYMAYCAPFVVAFAMSEMVRVGRWRTTRVWLELWATAAAVLLATIPFLMPYLEVQRRLGVERAADEVMRFSATLDHYRMALPGLAVPLVFALIAVVGLFATRQYRPGPSADRPAVPPPRPAAATRAWFVVGALLMLLVSLWLSLGPTIQSAGRAIDFPGLYGILYTYVPGYNGLRVPARFAMLFFFFLAILAGLGVAFLDQRWPRITRGVTLAALVVFLVRATPAAMPLNGVLPSEGLAPPPAYLTPAPELPAIYRAVDSMLRPGAILAEFPFGDSWYDLRYMYFAGTHRRRLLNGYSGIFPPSFLARQRILATPTLDPEAAQQALGGATHVIVHRTAWSDDTGAAIGAWLATLGARIVAEADGAVLYELDVKEGLARRLLGASVQRADQK